MSKFMRSIVVAIWLVPAVPMFLLPAGADITAQTHPASARSPLPAQKSLTGDGRMQIGDTDRCPVCGMFPAKRPKSAAAMVLADGRTFYFCGNGCLLRTWHAAPDYLNASQASIRRMVVRDYFTGEPIDATKAWWVAGSDVIGPMGPALVALGTEASVTQFKARHGGKKVFQLAEMDNALWEMLFPPKKK